MKKILFNFIFLAIAQLLFSQNEMSDSIQQVVISAHKTAEQKRDLPNQIEVISSQQIQKISPQTTADLLQNSGEVFVQRSQQGGGSPVLRGFESNKVLLVMDGVRMNTAIYRAGHLQNVMTVDPNSLDRVEILHGAGSVIYGTDAIGGVISLFTKRPQLSSSEKMEVKTGGYLKYATANSGTTAHANLNLGGKKWANYLAVTASDFGDLRSGKNDLKDYPNFGDKPFYVERVNGKDSVFTNSDPDVQKFSGYQQIDILEKLLFAPGGNFKHLFNVQYSNTSDLPRYDRSTDIASGKPRFAEWYYGPQERLMASYQLEYQADGKMADMIRLTPAFQKIEESRYDRRLNSSDRNERVEKLNAFSANLDLFKSVRKHEIRYGAEFVLNDLDSEGKLRNVNVDTTSALSARYPSGTYSTTGIYASHAWEIFGKKLILHDGLRFSSVNMDVAFDPNFFDIANLREVKQSSNSLNFNLGLVTNLPSGFRAAAMVSSGFRNPNIDDAGKIFVTESNNTLNIPNPDLKPEQVLHQELSLGQQFGEMAEINGTVFLSTLTDAIASRPTTYNGQNFIIFAGDTLSPVRSTNVAKAEVFGFSLRAKVRFAENFRISGSLMYTEGKDKTADVPLDHIPPLVGNVRFGYERATWQVETDVLFNGSKKLEDYSPSGEDNLQYATPDGMPAWTTWNLRGAKDFGKRIRVQAAVENILDLNYRVFASGINAAGRNFVLGLHWKFE